MKVRNLLDIAQARVRVLRHQPPRSRQDGRPRVDLRTRGLHVPACCERCAALFDGRTWRVPAGLTRPARGAVSFTLCPACAQVEHQEYFGHLRVTQPLAPEREAEVRRRIWNIERRARHTQPERRLVALERKRGGLEVFTTSQKLAHRMARELEKAFGGQAHYEWSEPDGALEATWTPPALVAAPRIARSPRTRS